jgi:hypothetical protein
MTIFTGFIGRDYTLLFIRDKPDWDAEMFPDGTTVSSDCGS